MRRTSKALIIVGALAGVAQVVRFPHANPPVHGDLVAPPEVKDVLRRACYDCHSNQTRWPWYTNLAPVSWLVHHEVEEGRRRLNFSDWAEYASDPDTAAHKLTQISEFVASGDMAPWYYRMLRPSARLSAAQRDDVIRWIKQEAGRQRPPD
jgi:heme-binding protein